VAVRDSGRTACCGGTAITSIGRRSAPVVAGSCGASCFVFEEDAEKVSTLVARKQGLQEVGELIEVGAGR